MSNVMKDNLKKITCYLVACHEGEYDDYTEWIDSVWENEQTARNRANEINKENKTKRNNKVFAEVQENDFYFENIISQLIEIKDFRPLLLKHPNQEMVRESCLHYLGDSIQELDAQNKLLKTEIERLQGIIERAKELSSGYGNYQDIWLILLEAKKGGE